MAVLGLIAFALQIFLPALNGAAAYQPQSGLERAQHAGHSLAHSIHAGGEATQEPGHEHVPLHDCPLCHLVTVPGLPIQPGGLRLPVADNAAVAWVSITVELGGCPCHQEHAPPRAPPSSR